jgi:predicted DNA-binding transcriptional regulator AlpA
MIILAIREEPPMKIYTMTDAAAAAGISTPTMARRVQAGRGPARIRIGRSFAITEQALAEWLAREKAA